MYMDKYLDQIQEDQIQEFEPIIMGTVAIGSGLILANFISFLLVTSNMKSSLKVDKQLTTRLNKILKPPKPYIVHTVKDKEANAFAVGGKHVFITSGLKKFLNPREVDAVLLHEVYHNKDLHIYKKMAYDYPLFYMAVAGAIVFGSATAQPILGFLAFVMILKIAKIPYNITVGRRHERKADDYAVQFGYGQDLINALKKLERQYKKLMATQECDGLCRIINKIDEAIDEHPTTKKRIESILKKANKLGAVLKTKSFGKIRDFVMKG